MVWLVKLEQNYHQNTSIGKLMGYKSSNQIIRECYEIDPNNEEIIDLFRRSLYGLIPRGLPRLLSAV